VDGELDAATHEEHVLMGNRQGLAGGHSFLTLNGLSFPETKTVTRSAIDIAL